MAEEKAPSMLDEIKKQLEEGGSFFPEEWLRFKAGEEKKIRFLSPFGEPLKLNFHEKWSGGGKRASVLPLQPCSRYYGKECPYHGEAYESFEMLVWTVYDYEAEAKRLLASKITQKALVAELMDLYFAKPEEAQSRDTVVKRRGKGMETTYRVRAESPSEFTGQYTKPYKQEKVMEILSSMIKPPKGPGKGTGAAAGAEGEDDEDGTRRAPAKEDDED